MSEILPPTEQSSRLRKVSLPGFLGQALRRQDPVDRLSETYKESRKLFPENVVHNDLLHVLVLGRFTDTQHFLTVNMTGMLGKGVACIWIRPSRKGWPVSLGMLGSLM